MLRLLLFAALFWFVYRLTKGVVSGLMQRTETPRRKPRRKNDPIEGREIIDVDYTETDRNKKKKDTP